VWRLANFLNTGKEANRTYRSEDALKVYAEAKWRDLAQDEKDRIDLKDHGGIELWAMKAHVRELVAAYIYNL
jgi:hypothetical protein